MEYPGFFFEIGSENEEVALFGFLFM